MSTTKDLESHSSKADKVGAAAGPSLRAVVSSDQSISPAVVEEMAASKKDHFNIWSALGMNYSIVGTPTAIGVYLAFNVGVGGSPVYIFGYLVATVFQIIVCASLAELAAVFPHPTGQVYWTSVLAPRSLARVLSYWVGSFAAAAWFFWTLGTYLLASQLLFATVSAAVPSHNQQPYQVYLEIVGAAVIAVIMNIPLFKAYSFLLRAMAFVINALTIIIIIVLLVRASPKQSARTVFVDLLNETGWSSDGFVFLLGFLPGLTSSNGFDASTHITDEVPNPAKQVPQVMLGTTLLAGISGFPMTILFAFCVVNQDNLLTPVGGQPLVQLFLDSTASRSITVFLMSFYLFQFFVGGGALTTTFSRVLWSLATERHMVMSKWLAQVSLEHQLPHHAIYFAAVSSCLVGLLYLGPVTALNAILGAAVVCFFISYMVPVGCLLLNRSKLESQPHYLDLGKFGVLANVVSMAWMAFMSVILLFPQYLPVTSAAMNYTIAVIAGVTLVFGLNWTFYARKRYRITGVEGMALESVWGERYDGAL